VEVTIFNNLNYTIVAGYIEALIPLLIGILCITSSKTLVKASDGDYFKKERIVRISGWVLAGVGVLFVFIEFFSHR
jgi:hypothetical protein